MNAGGTRQEGQVGPSTALLSMVIGAAVHLVVAAPELVHPSWVRHHTSDSAQGGPNPKMFGVLFHAAIQTALSGTLVAVEIAAASRIPEHRLL